MRKRFTWALLAAPATLFAGIGMMAGPATAAPKPAAPALGPAIATTGMAGYQASGRQFRWISSTIMVPNHQSAFWESFCTISPFQAPFVTATVGAGSTGPMVVTDTTTSTTLTQGVDYTVSPLPGLLPAAGPYRITLIHTANWTAGDLLTVQVPGASVTTLLPPFGNGIPGFGGTFRPTNQVGTCFPTVIALGQVAITDTTTGHGLTEGTDYTLTGTPLSTTVHMTATGHWTWGDHLKVSSLVYNSAYIQLSNGSLGTKAGQYVRTGVEPCALAQVASHHTVTCADGSWVVFIETYRNALSPFPRFAHYVPVSVHAGDGVQFHIYYNQGGNEIFFGISAPSGWSTEIQVNAHGAIFNYAAALVDYTDLAGNNPVVLPPFLHPVKVGTFVQGAITTINGNRGSFIGPWTTSPVVTTSNGLPWPSGTLEVFPTPLFSDGLPANGAVRPWDAFAVFQHG